MKFFYKKYKPMLLTSAAKAFDSPDYIFEIKYDGVRCFAYLGNQTALLGRSGKDFTPLFPEFNNLHNLTNDHMIIDGEIIVLTDGVPDFSRVLSRTSGSRATDHPAIFIAFDILFLGKEEVISLPLEQRKDLLNDYLSENDTLQISPFIAQHGTNLFAAAKQRNLEGIVAKRKKSVYLPAARTSDWLKIKCVIQEELIICGYINEPDSDEIRYLILGRFIENKLKYRTKIYIGFKPADKKKIALFAQSNRVNSPHFCGYNSAVWIRPSLSCKIEYLEQTASGKLRQPVYRGLTSD